MSQNETRFDIWWNSPRIKRLVGIVYSLGASVVIIGAMFKILHLPGASYVLGTGMTVEAILFALGIFDKPHKEFDWSKIYDFDAEQAPKQAIQNKQAGTPAYTDVLSESDAVKLSEGIKNLTNTATQFANLSNVIGATDQFAKTMTSASEATGKYIQNQESLTSASNKLVASYNGIAADMEGVAKNTKQYAGKVDDVTKNLTSINSIYEIQLKNIQAQSEGLTQQTEKVRQVSTQLDTVVAETQKIKAATTLAATETEKYKEGTLKLSKQISDLNQVYGNMLNALN